MLALSVPWALRTEQLSQENEINVRASEELPAPQKPEDICVQPQKYPGVAQALLPL